MQLTTDHADTWNRMMLRERERERERCTSSFDADAKRIDHVELIIVRNKAFLFFFIRLKDRAICDSFSKKLIVRYYFLYFFDGRLVLSFFSIQFHQSHSTLAMCKYVVQKS